MSNDPLAIPSRVFITGASGFIGRALACYYREQGATVCGIDFKADPEWAFLAQTAVWAKIAKS